MRAILIGTWIVKNCLKSQICRHLKWNVWVTTVLCPSLTQILEQLCCFLRIIDHTGEHINESMVTNCKSFTNLHINSTKLYKNQVSIYNNFCKNNFMWKKYTEKQQLYVYIFRTDFIQKEYVVRFHVTYSFMKSVVLFHISVLRNNK